MINIEMKCIGNFKQQAPGQWSSSRSQCLTGQVWLHDGKLGSVCLHSQVTFFLKLFIIRLSPGSFIVKPQPSVANT